MRQRAANEREHRRGLVLGLTLAEVLLLLLFLVLIALGARLINAERAVKDLGPLVEEIRKHPELAIIDARKLIFELARAKSLEKTVTELRDENARLQRELTDKSKKIDAVEKVAAAASALNPNDPPALLKFVPDAFQIVGVKVDRTRWKEFSELVENVYQKAKSMTAIERQRFRQSLDTFLASSEGTAPPHSWPPIIRLSEADGYFFRVGSAELTPDFAARIQDKVIPELMRISAAYHVDIIEVVGHTDEQAIASRPSNLDKELLPVLRHEKDMPVLIPADNAGLGLVRALAVVNILKRDDRLSDFRILPLSGAQLIQTDEMLTSGSLKTNVKERRRIEIRLRKRI
jgi:flagellar motor protein MotB